MSEKQKILICQKNKFNLNSQQQQDLKKKVAELLVVRASGHASDSEREYPSWELSNQELKTLLEEGVGGVILHGGTVNEVKERTAKLRNFSEYPILYCADVEEGVGQRFGGGSLLPPPMALGLRYLKDPEDSIGLAEEYGRCIGDQARRCGLNWVLAPVCDVNSNPFNPVINMRAWSSDPEIASALACAFHKGLVSQGVMSCAKHFPGHGDTRLDSHLELPILENDLEKLEQLELIPFKALIDVGVHSVMSAHVLFRKIDQTYPATFSKFFLIDLLRQKMGFEGLVVTDALLMKAISDRYNSGEAAVLAFEAGADLLLMPAKPYQAINALFEAFLKGRIPLTRLDQSLERRRKAIFKLEDSFSNKFKKEDSMESIEFVKAKEISLLHRLVDVSIQINNPFGINRSGDLVNLIKIDGILPCSQLRRTSPALMIPQQYGYRNIICHPLGVNPWKDSQEEPLALERFGSGPFLLQLFVRGNPFRGDQDIKEPWFSVIDQLQKRNILAGLVVYGSIYFWEYLLTVLEPSIPSAYSPGQMPEAQHKILSTLFAKSKGINRSRNNSLEFTN